VTTQGDRRAAETAWQAFVADGRAAGPGPVEGRAAPVRDDVLASWRRSASHVPVGLEHAPIVDGAPERWRSGPVARAFAQVEDELRRVALEGDLVAAVTDEEGAIVWMAGGRTMTGRAEQVAFVPGARWDEAAVGTNALALALRDGRPAQVFSAEHYAPMVHDWVCYSAPIRDLATGRSLGVIDLSTTWRKGSPLALSTVTALARIVELGLGAHTAVAGARARGLELRVLGRAEVRLDGVPLAVTPRQVEILAILAMAPDGLTLEELHDRLHGERPVAPGSTKADLSHLRRAVGGVLASRPYRLEGTVEADHVEVLRCLRDRRLADALAAYRGPLLPRSPAPAIEEARHVLAVAVRDAVLASGEPDLLVGLGEVAPDDPWVHERALAALAAADPRRALVQARLDAVR
jgi:hypothetical protein